MVNYSLNWPSIFAGSGGYSTTVNLLSQYQSGQFTTIQSVYIDNSTNAYAVGIVSAETGARVWAAPFTIGMYPLLVSAAAQFTVMLNALPSLGAVYYPLGSTQLFFLNTPQRPFQAQGVGVGSNFLAQQASVNIGTGPASVTVMPALGAGQHYALTSIICSLSVTGTFPFTGTNSQISIGGGSNSGNVFADTFYIPSTSINGQIAYSGKFAFATPVIQIQAASPLQFILYPNTNYPSGGGTFFFDITYNVVTIQ